MSRNVAVVMAAGKGTRMESEMPKALVEVCGRPMIDYVLDALAEGGIDQTVVVVGYRAELVRDQLSARDGLSFALQAEQHGTGHAVMMCREVLADHEGPVVVVACDSPLMKSKSIRALVDAFHKHRPACILGTAHKKDPHGLGRIVRDAKGDFEKIVEEKDATDAERRITEVNLSYYVFDCGQMFRALDAIRPDNAQGEYYLTDCLEVLKNAGEKVLALPILEPCESMSINDMAQLAEVEAEMRN